MAGRYGRAPRGERLVATVPHGHWKTSTFVAGLCGDSLLAPGVFDGPINGDLFLAYVQRVLVPTLLPNDTVIMDNLRSHKVEGVRQAIEAAGARQVFLPAYSPDLNPIEMVSSKQKTELRKQAIRSVDALWTALGAIAGTLTPQACSNYLRHCGYSQSR